MALAGDVLFVAGNPMIFPVDDPSKGYDGRAGGVLWVASAKDGKKIAEYKLDAAPAWDSIAVAGGKLFICLKNGELICWNGEGAGVRVPALVNPVF